MTRLPISAYRKDLFIELAAFKFRCTYKQTNIFYLYMSTSKLVFLVSINKQACCLVSRNKCIYVYRHVNLLSLYLQAGKPVLSRTLQTSVSTDRQSSRKQQNSPYRQLQPGHQRTTHLLLRVTQVVCISELRPFAAVGLQDTCRNGR